TSRWWAAPCSRYMSRVQSSRTSSIGVPYATPKARSMSDQRSSASRAAEPVMAPPVNRSSTLAAASSDSRSRERSSAVNTAPRVAAGRGRSGGAQRARGGQPELEGAPSAELGGDQLQRAVEPLGQLPADVQPEPGARPPGIGVVAPAAAPE